MPYEIDGIDLSEYSVDQLNALVRMAEAEIEHKRQTQIEDVRQQIEELAAEAGVSVEELLALKSGNGRKKTNGKAPVTVKYRDPTDPSKTWSGRGKRPRWFNELLETGYQLEELAA